MSEVGVQKLVELLTCCVICIAIAWVIFGFVLKRQNPKTFYTDPDIKKDRIGKALFFGGIAGLIVFFL